MNKKGIIMLMVCAFVFTAGQAFAQEAGVTSTLNVYLVTTNDDGKEVLVSAEEVEPGQTLEYQLTYTNNLSGAITNLKAVLPIPVEVEYLGQSNPDVDAASLSTSGNFQAIPIMREVTLQNGKTVERKLPPSAYRRLQWTVDTLGSQESVTLTARVRVLQNNS